MARAREMEEQREKFESEMREKREDDDRRRKEKLEGEERREREKIERKGREEQEKLKREEEGKGEEIERLKREREEKRRYEEEEAERKRRQEKEEAEREQRESEERERREKKIREDSRPFWQKLVGGGGEREGLGGGEEPDSLYLLPKAVLDLEHALNNAGEGDNDRGGGRTGGGGGRFEFKHGSSFVVPGHSIAGAVDTADSAMVSSSLGKAVGGWGGAKEPEMTPGGVDYSGSEDSYDSLDIQVLHQRNLKKYERHGLELAGEGGGAVPELQNDEDGALLSLRGAVRAPSSSASSRESARSNLGSQGYASIYNKNKYK